MSVYEEMQAELNELVRLIRLDEQFLAVMAHEAAVPFDIKSASIHYYRLNRIAELSKKYGLSVSRDIQNNISISVSSLIN